MAGNQNGAPGSFTGTIYPVTGFMRNGQNLLRSGSSSAKNKGIPLQLSKQERINTCTRFVKIFFESGPAHEGISFLFRNKFVQLNDCTYICSHLTA